VGTGRAVTDRGDDAESAETAFDLSTLVHRFGDVSFGSPLLVFTYILPF
jgi:hypothetical protein